MLIERKPNLFLVGAMRSGTSYLHELLNTHPQIFMCYPKEPSHFVARHELKKIWPEMERQGYWCKEHYLQLFEDAGSAKVVGESSTNYSKIPIVSGVHDRLYRFNPEARVIYIMRDPVERAISHYWHRVLFSHEHRSIMSALERDPQFLEVSNYAKQLTPYLERFGTDKVFTLTFESLLKEPQRLLAQLYGWLQVEDDFCTTDLQKPVFETPATIEFPKGLGLLSRLRHSETWGKISPHVPKPLRRLGVCLACRPTEREAVDLDSSKQYLRRNLEPRVLELSTLLGREFSEWKSVASG